MYTVRDCAANWQLCCKPVKERGREREKELQLGTAFWLNALARPRKMILINVALSVLRIANV